ncbi:MAG: elongation factor P, C-terminal-domain-containing protein [Podila humilis]|nr:MAG: elongation factor P, C-terminal-domain-containing protein [Podila humilis]
MGRGTSTIKLDLQDLLTGAKHTERYRSGDMVEVTELDDLKCQFLYQAEGVLHLMDPESFEMYEVPASVLEEKQLLMLLPDMQVNLSLFQPDPDAPGTPIAVRLPAQAIFEVKETHASAAQANKGTVYKNADLENGIKVQVPDFVNTGDKVVVDTETGKYVRRA